MHFDHKQKICLLSKKKEGKKEKERKKEREKERERERKKERKKRRILPESVGIHIIWGQLRNTAHTL